MSKQKDPVDIKIRHVVWAYGIICVIHLAGNLFPSAYYGSILSEMLRVLLYLGGFTLFISCIVKGFRNPRSEEVIYILIGVFSVLLFIALDILCFFYLEFHFDLAIDFSGMEMRI